MVKKLETRLVLEFAEIERIFHDAGRGNLPAPVHRDIFPFMHDLEFITREGDYATLTIQQSYLKGPTNYFLSISRITTQ